MPTTARPEAFERPTDKGELGLAFQSCLEYGHSLTRFPLNLNPYLRNRHRPSWPPHSPDAEKPGLDKCLVHAII